MVVSGRSKIKQRSQEFLRPVSDIAKGQSITKSFAFVSKKVFDLAFCVMGRQGLIKKRILGPFSLDDPRGLTSSSTSGVASVAEVWSNLKFYYTIPLCLKTIF